MTKIILKYSWFNPAFPLFWRGKAIIKIGEVLKNWLIYVLLSAIISFTACSNKQDNKYTPSEQRQLSSFAFSDITDTSASFIFSKGSGQNRIIVITENDSTALPTDGVFYIPGTVYSDSAKMNNSDTYVIYNSGVKNHPRNYNISGLKPNTKYTIRGFEYSGKDSAVKYQKESSGTNPRTFHTLRAAPKDLKTTSITKDGFEFKWTAESDVQFYEFDLATDEDFNNYVDIYKAADIGNEGIYELVELKKGTYYYRIRANANNQKSTYSKVEKIIIGGRK